MERNLPAKINKIKQLEISHSSKLTTFGELDFCSYSSHTPFFKHLQTLKINLTKATNQISYSFPINESISETEQHIVSFNKYRYIICVNADSAQQIHQIIQEYLKCSNHKEASYSKFIPFQTTSSNHPIASKLLLSGEELFALDFYIEEFLQAQHKRDCFVFVNLETGQKQIYCKVIGDNCILNTMKSNPLNQLPNFGNSFFLDNNVQQQGTLAFTISISVASTIETRQNQRESLILVPDFSYFSYNKKKISCYPCLGFEKHGNICDKNNKRD